jgi:hypothetical protein
VSDTQQKIAAKAPCRLNQQRHLGNIGHSLGTPKSSATNQLVRTKIARLLTNQHILNRDFEYVVRAMQ